MTVKYKIVLLPGLGPFKNIESFILISVWFFHHPIIIFYVIYLFTICHFFFGVLLAIFRLYLLYSDYICYIQPIFAIFRLYLLYSDYICYIQTIFAIFRLCPLRFFDKDYYQFRLQIIYHVWIFCSCPTGSSKFSNSLHVWFLWAKLFLDLYCSSLMSWFISSFWCSW